MNKLELPADGNVLVGASTLDDAGVFRVSDDLALVQTVDFFTPIVDDPFDYGRIAAANSLSDVYAMGGRPLTALNILAFPDGDLPEEALLKILEGSLEVCRQAGVAVLGGHSVSDRELKFGLAVTGTVHPQRMLTNANTRPGDLLVLTKPLGSGLIANAMMNDAAKDDDVAFATEVMARLNRVASEAAVRLGAHAMTDITGFGLLGHIYEFAVASGLSVELVSSRFPLLPGALEIAGSGSYYSGGERRNWSYVEPHLELDPAVDMAMQRIASDPQTSGGLLIALPENIVDELLRDLSSAGEEGWIIGRACAGEAGHLRLILK